MSEPTKPCRFCTEQVPISAIRCSHCQADLKSELTKSLEKGVGCFVMLIALYLLLKLVL